MIDGTISSIKYVQIQWTLGNKRNGEQVCRKQNKYVWEKLGTCVLKYLAVYVFDTYILLYIQVYITYKVGNFYSSTLYLTFCECYNDACSTCIFKACHTHFSCLMNIYVFVYNESQIVM